MRRYVGRAAIVCAVLGSAPLVWHGAAARRAEAPVQGRSAVRLLPQGERLGGKSGQKGATYYALAARTRRLTTRFATVVTVAEAGADGDIHTTVRDSNGRDLGHLVVDHLDADRDVVQFTSDTGARFQAFGETGVKMTLDWANRQAYSLATDGVDAGQPDVEWRNGLIRRRGASPRDLDREIVSLETEWEEGLMAATSRRPAARRKVLPGSDSSGEVVVTRLTRDGQQVGVTNWFPRERIFTWNLPGLSKGTISPATLAEQGGWTFTPDLEWMNLQAIAFHHFKTLIDQQRFVADAGRPWFRKAIDAIVPVLHADEEGCDGLHWLDGSIFRFCCDVHDACYAKNGCSSQSWWQFWSSWRCTACNAWVVDCFQASGEPLLMYF